MRQYNLNDIKDLLAIIKHGTEDINTNDIKNLHELNILFLIKRIDICYNISMMSNIKAFIKFLRLYSEEYTNFIDEIFELCIKASFTKISNCIKILSLSKISIEEIKKMVILSDDYISEIIEAYLYKEFTEEV